MTTQRTLRFVLISFCLSCILLTSVCHAQFTPVGIGADPIRGESYECLRTDKPKKNKVRVTSISGNLRAISRSAGTRRLRRSLKRANTLTRKARVSLRKSRKQRNRLISSIILTLNIQEKIASLSERISSLEARIEELSTVKAIIRETVSAIRECGKKSDLTGSFTPVSGTYTDSRGRVIFYSYYFYVITDWDPEFSTLCIRPSAGGPVRDFRVFPPSHCIEEDPFTDVDRCFLTGQSAFNGRYFVYVTGNRGVQDPGTCDPTPWNCSLAEAQQKADSDIADISFQLVGIVNSASDCPR